MKHFSFIFSLLFLLGFGLQSCAPDGNSNFVKQVDETTKEDIDATLAQYSIGQTIECALINKRAGYQRLTQPLVYDCKNMVIQPISTYMGASEQHDVSTKATKVCKAIETPYIGFTYLPKHDSVEGTEYISIPTVFVNPPKSLVHVNPKLIEASLQPNGPRHTVLLVEN